MQKTNDLLPKALTAEMLGNFVTTERGCTHPRVGTIDGCKFIAKCGGWSEHSSDGHVHNEWVADNFLRTAGLNVPMSKEYWVDFKDGLRLIRLADFGDTLEPIMQAWNRGDFRREIRAQVIAAYPVQALVAGIDTFTWDNVRVDAEGNLWFVDNGASFDFRACGKKKGWFWKRTDLNDSKSGYLSLARHPDQHELQTILGAVDDDELWHAAKRYDFRKLVAQLPDGYQQTSLLDYAKKLDAIAKERNN